MLTMSASPAIHSSSVFLLLFLLVRFPVLHLPLGWSGTPLRAYYYCMDWLDWEIGGSTPSQQTLKNDKRSSPREFVFPEQGMR